MTSDRDLEVVDGCPMAQTFPGGPNRKSWKFEQDIFSRVLSTSKNLIMNFTTPQKTIYSDKLKQNCGSFCKANLILDS